MITIKTPLVAALALFTATAAASKLFCNTGVLGGWDSTTPEAQGTVDAVSNVVYKGTSALKMTQTFIPGYQGRYHSEAMHAQGYKRNDELFYGFTFRLSETWEFDPQSYNLAQFIAFRSGAGCDDDDWMPSSMIWLVGDQLMSRTVTGHYRQPDCSRTITPYNLTTITRGVWHKVVIQARWKSDNTGFYKIWVDGERVLALFDLPTTIDDDSQFQFRVGLYANGWHDNNHQMVGSQGFRQVWYDEVAIGTTFADVDPDQTSC